MDELLELLDAVSLDDCLPAHGDGAHFFLSGKVGTMRVAERRRMESFLFLKCSRATDSRSEERIARLTFSQLGEGELQ